MSARNLKLACVQADVAFGDPELNAGKMLDKLEVLAADGVQLAIWPEAYLTGYCVDSREDAERIAIPLDHPVFAQIQAFCDRLAILAVVGFAEKAGGTLHNAAALIEPGEPIRTYRKSHLPVLGYDRFAEAGHSLEVFKTAIGRIGIIICYDQRPPEPARCLALDGADLIVLPTNWPDKAQFAANLVAPVRAAENMVHYAACDRVGNENGTQFIGLSGIYDPFGRMIAKAGDQEEVLIAEIDLNYGASKRIVNIPGEYEMAVMDERQPDIYEAIAKPYSSKPA